MMEATSAKKICFLALGSNLGDRLRNLKQAVSKMASSRIYVESLSSLYETEPVDVRGGNSFYNMVIKARTDLLPEELLKSCLGIESGLGRMRKKRNEPRVLDIDILFYDQLIIEKNHLKVPHPRMHLRKFVLIPLHEIVSDFIHPELGKTIDVLLRECPDQAAVRKCRDVAPFLTTSSKLTI
jgi:2-amino-4-hydroxy-6-hydroxymethyldihydropteridine diphosphokinase